MNNNVYATPEAPLLMADQLPEHDLYVVSTAKFLVLFIATMGLYGVYWFYKNFRQQKDRHNLNIRPVPRSIFSIFYAHSLFKIIDEKLKAEAIDYSWNSRAMATTYVVSAVLANIVGNLGLSFANILAIGFTLIVCFCLYSAQKAINISQGDADGVTNAQYTLANYIWILVGVVFWGLTILGILMTSGVIEGG